jgi:hypothetical protein
MPKQSHFGSGSSRENRRQARPRYGLEFIYTEHPVPHQVAWYKWEFLRRNAGYRADYRQFVQKFGTWFASRGYWYDYDRRQDEWSKADENYFYRNIAPVIGKLCAKWHVGNLFPPKWRFDKRNGIRLKGSRELGPPTAIAADLNWDFQVMKEIVDMGFTGTADSARRYRNLLLIEFDLDRPMKDSIRYAKYVLQRAQENYATERAELGLIPKQRRRRLEDYDMHLVVWDMKQQGKSVSEIAAHKFAVEARHSAIQKVRDHLRVAEKLISGGYAEIS